MGKKIPAEYSGGGTVLSNTNTTTSAYNATNGSISLCSLNLTKGIWIVHGFISRSTSESRILQTRLRGANAHDKWHRSAGESGGGVDVVEIVTVNDDSAKIVFDGYQFSDVSQTSTFTAYLQAYKISDY